MTTNHTAAQLKEGRDAMTYLSTYMSAHGTMPKDVLTYMHLPIEVVDPKTGASRVVILGEMTPGDMQDWATSEEAAARDRYLAGLEGNA